MSNDVLLMDYKAAKENLGISRTMFYELLNNEELEEVNIGTRRFATYASILDFINNNKKIRKEGKKNERRI